MNRYNIFYQVHKGLREMLYNTASRLQQTDFSNPLQTASVTAQLNEVLDLFDKHAGTEDYMILPAIAQYEPSVTTLFAEEHVQDHAIGEKLRSIIKGLLESASLNDRNTWGAVLRPVFIEFMVFNLNHMAKEEEVLNKLLWRYYSDEELQGITQKILGYLPPETLQQYSAWMLRGLSNNEISEWLKQVKATAPEFLFTALITLAEQELPAGRWNLVQETIRDGAIAA
jgi:hemerythrin-like domain-containing protein